MSVMTSIPLPSTKIVLPDVVGYTLPEDRKDNMYLRGFTNWGTVLVFECKDPENIKVRIGNSTLEHLQKHAFVSMRKFKYYAEEVGLSGILSKKEYKDKCYQLAGKVKNNKYKKALNTYFSLPIWKHIKHELKEFLLEQDQKEFDLLVERCSKYNNISRHERDRFKAYLQRYPDLDYTEALKAIPFYQDTFETAEMFLSSKKQRRD